MSKDKRSFFQRLTGAVDADEYDEDFDAMFDETEDQQRAVNEQQDEDVESNEVGQLTVDVYQKDTEIVIKAIVAGVKPEDLDVSITRDMVTIQGRRDEEREVSEPDYFFKELYWGGFSRTILLPQEVEVEDATAVEKHGVLTLRLPKIDKEKQTKLKVKAS